jgi:hypothetical protein
MVDLYYNSPAWQKIARELICGSESFVRDFTAFLREKMVLDTPVSVERRGVLLYEYCREHQPRILTEVSIAWIEAGLSLKKEPAGNVQKIKHLKAFLDDEDLQMSVRYGLADVSHRYYLLSSGERRIIFGYDSLEHQPAPVFMAEMS